LNRESMPRVSEIDLETLPEAARNALGARRQSDLGGATWERVAGHCPEALGNIVRLMRSFREHGTLSTRHTHIAVVTVSRLNACRHCVGRHSVRLADQGLSHDTIAAILEPDCPGLDEAERLVRDYAKAVSENSAMVPEAFFTQLKEHFSEAQIVELTMRIALAGFFNRFNNAMQVDLDEAHLAQFLAQSGTEEDLPAPSS